MKYFMNIPFTLIWYHVHWNVKKFGVDTKMMSNLVLHIGVALKHHMPLRLQV